MKKTLLLIGLAIPILLLGAAAGLLYTETGLHWSFRALQAVVPGKLEARQLTGRLAGPLKIEDLRYEDTSMSFAGGTLRLDWAPARLLAGRVRIETLAVSDVEIAINRPAESSDRPADFVLPLPLPVTVIEARGLRIRIRPPAGEPVVITRLETGFATRKTQVVLDHLHVENPLGSVNASGRIPLRADGELALETDWHADYGRHSLSGHGTVSGTLQHVRTEQRLERPIDLNVKARLDTDLQPLRWRVDAEAEPFSLARLMPQARPVRFSHGRLHAQGKGTVISADGSFDVNDDDYGGWAVTLTGKWDGTQWRIPSFTIAAMDGEARISGSVAQRPSDYRLAVEWTDLVWPPRGGPLVSSPIGTAKVTGRPDDYRLNVDANLRHESVPEMTLNLGGNGDRTGMELDDIRMGWLDGEWSGHGRLAWSGVPDWALHLDTRNINPAPLLAGLDGRLNGEITLEGRGGGPDFRLAGEVTRLSGALHDTPVSGGARFAVKPGGVTVSKLELHSGEAELRGAADLGARWNIDWQLSAPDLSQFHRMSSGELRSHGNVSGKPDALRIDAAVRANELSYRDHAVGALTADARIDLGNDGPWRMDIESDRTVVSGRELGRVTVNGSGSVESHTIQVRVENDTHRYEQTVDGSFADQRWRARLGNGVVEHDLIGRWLQSEPAVLVASRGGARMEEWCWHDNDARICAQGTWTGGGDGTASVTWEDIDLTLIEPLLAARQIRMSGRIHGALQARIADASLDSGTLALAVEDGTVGYPLPMSEESHRMAFERATTTAVAGTTEGLRIDGNVVFNENERLSARLTLPNWTPEAPALSDAQPIEGALSLRLEDLSVVTLLLPDVRPSDARLLSDLDISGTVGDPRLAGELDLELAELTVARLGVVLEHIDVRGLVEGDRWELQGTVESGPGRLTVNGEGALDGLRRWNGRFDVNGERFQALRLPTAMVLASPDLHIDIRPGDIAFDGTLRIPAANVAPQLSDEAATVSEDVVIKGGDAPAGPARPQLTHGTIDLVLGDEIVIEGEGFEGRLEGRLHLTVHRRGDITAEGELRIVQGRYEAYGQRLEISRGRLLYAGGSIDNPAIDIVAKRRKVDVEVGIRVTGTAERPVLELFSDPAMDDGDILSYLILGRPMNQASGADGRLLYQAAASVALIGGEALTERIATEFNLEEAHIEAGEKETDTSLVLGKRLSPRLYMRYIQGLVDNTSAFQLRYELSDKWTLETESGTTGAGTDLLFNLEK